MKLIILLILLMPFVNAFETNTILVKSVVDIGEVVNPSISIINYEQGDFEIAYGSEGFLSINEDNFYLGDDESKNIILELDSSGLNEGVYTGQISINTEKKSQKIPVIFEIESPKFSFDSVVEARVENENLNARIKILNLFSAERRLGAEYFVKDLEGNIILEDFENIDVLNQVEFSKSYYLPNLEYGDYIFGIKLRNGNEISTSSSLFSVSGEVLLSPEKEGFDYSIIGFIIVLVLIVAFLIFNYFWNRRVIDTKDILNQKLVDLKKIKFSDINKEIRNFEYKKSVLERAYGKGYITKKSYTEGRNKINDSIQKLKKRL